MNSGLLAHRFLVRIALSGAGTFAWIFTFQYYWVLVQSVPGAIVRTALLYLIVQTITALLTPLTARMIRNGVRRAMGLGMVSASIAFVSLGLVFSGAAEGHISYAITSFGVFLGLYRAQYWIPYTVEKTSGTFHRDFIMTAEDFIVAGMPLLFGITLSVGISAEVWLLYLSALLLIVSLIPLAFVTEKYERFTWGYLETFGHLLEPRFQNIVVPSLLDGAQSATMYFLWPLVVFMLVGYSYTALGAVVSLALMLAIPARMFAKAYARIWRFESPAVPIVISGSVWLMRLMVSTPIGIILVDALSVTNPTRGVAISAPAFEHAADGGSYIDELSALKEIALAMGRIFMVSVVCSLTIVLPLPYALIIAFLAVSLFAMVSVGLQHKRETSSF